MSEKQREWFHEYRSVPIGVRVMACRKKRGLSQVQLASKAGATQSSISQIESGDRNPSWLMLTKIAKALDAQLTFGIPSAGGTEAVER